MIATSFQGEAGDPVSARVAVAMSGGVDSSVAAALLKQQGLDVVGVTLKLQECSEVGGSLSCCGADGAVRARSVAAELGIPHYVLESVREFEREVLRPAWEDYAAGRTPSPCLLCNERIKFGLLLAWARRIGAGRVATGHYARIELSAEGEPMLLRGVDPEKDQSYFLAGLNCEQLSSVLFPLGGMDKAAVRRLGRSLGLATAGTPESQDACLTGPGESFAEVLRQRFSGDATPGDVVDEAGKVLGRHPGIHHFTVGQRRGLAVPSRSRRWVKNLRPEDGTVVVTDREDHLYSTSFDVIATNWLVPLAEGETLECDVKIRYSHPATAATVRGGGAASASVTVHQAVRAVTPGQAAVFYRGSRVLGRGWIREVQDHEDTPRTKPDWDSGQ